MTTSTADTRSPSHFAGLNTARFAAAMLVLFAHGEAIREHRGVPSFIDLSFFHNGAMAVSFFFVLSGFLITTVLLREQDSMGKISVGLFYQRRAMRILPLYGLLVILGIGVIPAMLPLLGISMVIPYQPWTMAGWYVVMMPFVVNLYHDVFVIGPLWSIGVEEWYYLAIAPVMNALSRHITSVFAGVIVVKLFLLALVDAQVINGALAGLTTILSFENMAAGGLAALAVRKGKAFSERQSRQTFGRPLLPLLLYTAYGVIALRVFAQGWLCQAIPAVHAITESYTALALLDMLVFSFVMYYIALWPPSLQGVVGRWSEKLGEYSYGIYMYHNVIAFSLSYGLFSMWIKLDRVVGSALYHLLLSSITIATAWLSHQSFEKYFLGKQRRPEKA
ncbi:MAG: hypothetical protein RL156_1003 [Bacteroidota bacterium]